VYLFLEMRKKCINAIRSKNRSR